MAGRSHSPVPRINSDLVSPALAAKEILDDNDSEQSLFHLMSPEAVFKFLSAKIPGIRVFRNVWQISGRQLLSFEPQSLIRALQVEFMSFPFSVGVEVFKLVQARLAEEISVVNNAGLVHPFDEDLLSSWATAAVPSVHNFLAKSNIENVLEPQTPGPLPAGVPQILGQMFTPRNQFTNSGQLFSPQLAYSGYKPSDVSRQKFVIGGPRTPLQNSLAANSLLANSNSNVFGQFPMLSTNFAIQSLGQMVASAAPMPIHGQTAASVAQLPHLQSQTVASAAQMLQGQTVASAAQMPQFQSQTVASAAQMLPGQTAASAAQLPHYRSQTVASAAQMLQGQTVASAAQKPPNPIQMVASAAQEFFQNGQTAADVAQAPSSIQRQLFQSPNVQVSDHSDPASFSLIGLLQNNPMIAQLFHTVQAQATKAKPILPWEAAALAEPFIQDPSMPKGYKRLSMSTVIANAKAERLANPTRVDTAKAVRWPMMNVFNKNEFIRVRKEYYECVQSASQSGIISTFKSCMTLVARNTAMGVFELNDVRFGKLDDNTFMNWCALYFGPRNKKEALARLKDVNIFHRDGKGCVGDFIAKFDAVCYDHEVVVNDIVDSQYKWPFDQDDIECSALTEKEIAKEWKELFPKQDGKVFSVPLRKCRRFIEQNLQDAEGQEDCDGRDSKSEFHSFKKDHSRAHGAAFGGSTNQPTSTGGSVGKRSLSSGTVSKSKFVKRVIPGHARGLSCGSLNNHFGLGCHKDTCPAFGTEYDKSKGRPHVWKSSDDEESVRLPNEVYKQRLAQNPKIQENWKKASHELRSKPKVKVAAFGTKEDDVTPDQDDIDRVEEDVDDEVHSESTSDNDDEVNTSYYFDEAPKCHVAAACAGSANLSDLFTELGHEEQFSSVTRFASNDAFRSRTLMDPGATINIISPMLANRSAIQRKQIAVNIFQGKRKMASVDEMVQCEFELMMFNGEWRKHVEWFAVCDLGYEILLGRRFCRVQKLTSFDEKLKRYDLLPESPHRLSAAAFDVEQWVQLRFERVQANDGAARYRRGPKAVQGLANCDQTSIGRELLTAKNVLSSLKIVESSCVDGKEAVLLEFTVDTVDRKGSQMLQQWFPVVDGRELKLSRMLVSKLMAEVKTLLAMKSKQVARKAVEPVDFIKRESPALTEKEKADWKLAVSLKSEKTRKANELRFASYHPVQRYRLHRNAEKPPLSPHWTKDHQNYLASYDYRGERARVKAAIEAASLEKLCRRKQHQFRAMLSVLSSESSQSRGVSADVDCWLDELAIEKRDLTANEKLELADGAVECGWTSVFKQGEYVEIVNAVVKPEFNGQRVRLYSQTDAEGLWIVRLLGKNSGKRRCHESLFKALSSVEQQRSVPSAAQAGFDDVGIDESGQPNIECKALAHRQFGEEFSAELTKRINLLKEKYPTVFTTDVSEPCNFEPMKIRLIPNAVLPSKARFYRNTPKMREEVRRQIQEQLDWGAIVKCVTPCVSDVLLVKRPHMPGKFRFVVSYVKLNDATVKEQLLMPDPKSQHERLAGCSIFGALDFSSYYRQIRLHEDSQYLTGFASDEGTYCYTRVPMGITGACQYAQKVLQDALAQDPVLGPLGIRNYFDDLPFGARSEDEFMRVLEALLEFCVKWKLKINPEKTVLGVKSITHVGFVVSKEGVAIDPERTRDIKELTPPKSIKKVQSILGIFNYVRNFIPDFSGKAKFLTDKLGTIAVASSDSPKATRLGTKRKASDVAALSVESGKPKAKGKVQKKFEWSEEDTRQFEALKDCVLQAPLLAHLDYSMPIYVRCDASRFGCGAVLFQYDSRGYEHPVCYASRKFLPAERNWSTFSQEASTVVWALERFSEYTQGYHVIVECDHRNISFVKKSAMPQLARWRLRLQDMDFSVRYLSGPRNVCSDGLSRQHVDEVEVGLSDVIPECALSEEECSSSDKGDVADIASIMAEQAVNYDFKLAAFERSTSSLEFTDSFPTDGVARDLTVDGLSDSESDGSSCLQGDDILDPAELDDDGVMLNSFGPNGELLDEMGQPRVREELQPAHLAIPLLDAESEIAAVHNDLVGHAGTYVTLQRALKNTRHWGSRKQLIEDIDKFIRACPCCQKMRKRSSRSLVDRHVISGSPFSEISVDLLKLPQPDAFGMAYVVVIVDNFSHWTSLVAVRNKSVFEAARAVVKVIGDFGVPMRIRSDGGAEFVNGILTGLLRMMGASHHVVVPYAPTANGIVERANRAILERLREMIFSKRLVKHPEHVWSDLLPLVQRSINASVHSATGTSPAKILFGDNLDLDRCLLTHMPCARDLDVTKYVDALTYNQRIILEEADAHQSELCRKVVDAAHKAQRRKTKNGEVVVPRAKEIAVNDWVLVSPAKTYPLHKLSPRWLGPFRVLECSESSEVVTVEDTLKKRVRRFLRRQLELFDITKVADVEGLKRVAESDGFEFPVEQIMGHALVEEGGVGVAPVQLPASFKRGTRPKRMFQFLIKWSGYEEPTWVEYKVASRLVQFPGYVAFLPGLRMD
jgi:hypothetical protein